MNVSSRVAIRARAIATLLAVGGLAVAPALGAPPDWAYPGCPVKRVPNDDGPPVSVPGSTVMLRPAQTHERSVPPDWFPDEHGTPPAVVMAGATTATYACGFCHLPDGQGRPENAKLAGLPASYILRQVAALKSGERREGLEGWFPTRAMVAAIADLPAAQLTAAADYFAAERARSVVRVVEATTIPAYATACYSYVAVPGERVALGERIIELPEDLQRFERRDPHVAIVAYVPVGSIARGQRLAVEARGPAPACTTCHGPDLRGGAGALGPPLAGRYPGYLFRQLLGFRTGTRNGAEAAAMRAVVAELSEADMIAAAAFAASRSP